VSRWEGVDATAYDRRWQALAAMGESVHGEADLVCRYAPASVLDGGCGTGRVAIELARRGIDVVGVDLDDRMLDAARAKAPDLPWHHADLATIDLDRRFDAVVLAGNVMIFVAPGWEAAVVANLAEHLAPRGVLLAGFQIQAGRYAIDDYDEHCRNAGLVLEARWSTWEGAPFTGGAYAVSVHRRA